MTTPPQTAAQPSLATALAVKFKELIDSSGKSLRGISQVVEAKHGRQVSAASLSEWSKGEAIPSRPEVLAAVLEELHRLSGRPFGPLDRQHWERARLGAEAQKARLRRPARGSAPAAAGPSGPHQGDVAKARTILTHLDNDADWLRGLRTQLTLYKIDGRINDGLDDAMTALLHDDIEFIDPELNALDEACMTAGLELRYWMWMLLFVDEDTFTEDRYTLVLGNYKKGEAEHKLQDLRADFITTLGALRNGLNRAGLLYP